MALDQGTVSALRFVADVLTRHAATGTVQLDDPEVLAGAFLRITVDGPATGLMWGVVIDPDALDHRIRTRVRVFLDGVRP